MTSQDMMWLGIALSQRGPARAALIVHQLHTLVIQDWLTSNDTRVFDIIPSLGLETCFHTFEATPVWTE